MKETENVSQLISGSVGRIVTQDQPSTALPVSLEREGLTSLQQLNKSGNILIQSMEKVVSLSTEEEFNVMEVVECAKALAITVQTQSNLVKVLKEFIK